MRRTSLLFAVLVALPAFAQDAQQKKPRAKRGEVPLAHTKPTPQQIREFNKLEKEEEKHEQQIRGRSPNSAPEAVRAPSPK